MEEARTMNKTPLCLSAFVREQSMILFHTKAQRHEGFMSGARTLNETPLCLRAFV
jgi:hypothetical protein